MSTEIVFAANHCRAVRLTKDVLLGANVPVPLHVASDGAEPMAFLNREADSVPVPRPALYLAGPNHSQRGCRLSCKT